MNNNEKSPNEYMEELMKMAREYDRIGNDLVQIRIKKATEIILIRSQVKSDAQAERVFQATEEGLLELQYSFQLKSYEKLMSVIKLKLRLMANEEYRG